MPNVANPHWIPLERIEAVVQPEPAIMLVGLAIIAWCVYKLFLRRTSQVRHANLQRDFRSLALNMLFSAVVTGTFWLLAPVADGNAFASRLVPYFALLSLVAGLIVFVKIARIFIYEYLIASHMRVGVPVLILNLCTLVLGVVLAIWVATGIFTVDLGPLLATSAFLSVVLGLALQDTLGNLFAGIAMQFDWKPYEIGDWIEVNNGGQKWIGQVDDISWRATTLLGYLDEEITVPNKVVAQSQINNYSTKERPMIRTQTYRLPFGCSIPAVKEILLRGALAVREVRKHPAPLVIVPETTESWIAFRLVYYIDDFGNQYLIGDSVNTAVIESMTEAGLHFAKQTLVVERPA